MKRIVIVILICSGILIMPIFFKSLRYDFINRGGVGFSFSESKEESIERGVYICDLALDSFYKEGDSVNFIIKEAWIEKIWRQGSWYWTTIPEDNSGYSLILHTNLKADQESKLYIINDRISALGNYEGLGCASSFCTGTIRKLPDSDTLRYNILKKRNLDFSNNNITGELILLVKKN